MTISATETEMTISERNDFRQRVINGEPINRDELRKAIELTMGIRAAKAAPTEPKKPKQTKAAARKAAADQLGDLLG